MDQQDGGVAAQPEQVAGGSLVLGTAAAGLAALAGALAWAGIGYATKYEIGILAWALGGLVGFAMMRFYMRGGFVPGALAVILVVGSILMGKALMMDWHLTSDASVQEILKDKDLSTRMTLVGHYLLLKERADSPAKQMAAADVAVCDALMLDDEGEMDKLTPEQSKLFGKLFEEFKTLSDDQKKVAVTRALEHVASKQAFVDKLKPTISKSDVIFFLLAIVTAFKIAARPRLA